MGEAGLQVFRMHSFVGGEGIGDDRACEVFAQNSLSGLGGTVLVQMKESQIIIAGIPDPVALAVVTPGGLIGVRNGESLDFLAQVLVDRRAAARGKRGAPVGHPAWQRPKPERVIFRREDSNQLSRIA